MRWRAAMRPGRRRAPDPARELHQLLAKAGRLKASTWVTVERPFREVKQQFGYAQVRNRGPAKYTARMTMRFALGHWWMVHRPAMPHVGALATHNADNWRRSSSATARSRTL